MIPNEKMLELGFAMGPLDGKKAFLPGGFHDFTTDRGVLERQAKRWPNCNWGGTCEGVMVLDEDPRNGGNLESLKIPAVLQTLVVRTGSGGRHAYFQFAGKVRGKIQQHDGIDLKTWRTGYTVMPGSIHPETGKPYRIEVDLPIAPLPELLLPLVEVSEYKPRPATAPPEVRNHGVVRKVAEAHGGGRNAITFWAFCRALERGSSDLVDEIRSAALSTGLEEREIDTCLRSAERTTGRAA